MGTLAPAIVSAVGSAAGAGLQAAQASRHARQTVAANNAELAHRNQQVALAHRIEERRRKRKLKENQARQRARAGAGGTGIGGSQAALLAGLNRQSALFGREGAQQRILGLQGSLLDVQNRNRAALLRAAAARENAALQIGSAAARLAAADPKKGAGS